MPSEFMSVENEIQQFTQHAIFACPVGTARVVSGERLSVTERALLRYFRRHAGQTLSREELAEQVWKQRYFYGSRTIDQTVSKLRKKLRREDGKILSVRWDGYRFETYREDRKRKIKSPTPRR